MKISYQIKTLPIVQNSGGGGVFSLVGDQYDVTENADLAKDNHRKKVTIRHLWL
jgi:hypothetical protein